MTNGILVNPHTGATSQSDIWLSCTHTFTVASYVEAFKTLGINNLDQMNRCPTCKVEVTMLSKPKKIAEVVDNLKAIITGKEAPRKKDDEGKKDSGTTGGLGPWESEGWH